MKILTLIVLLMIVVPHPSFAQPPAEPTFVDVKSPARPYRPYRGGGRRD